MSDQEEALTRPALTDLDQIGPLYASFQAVVAADPRYVRPESVTRRKQFIFIVLLLYSPVTLAGDKLGRGLRDRVAELFEVSPVVVSNNINNAIFMYQRYRPFRQEVDALLAALLARPGLVFPETKP